MTEQDNPFIITNKQFYIQHRLYSKDFPKIQEDGIPFLYI